MVGRFCIAGCCSLVMALSLWWQSPTGRQPAPAPALQAEVARLNTEGAEALRRGDLDNAIQAFQQLSRVAPAVAEFQANLAFAYYSAGRFREAIPPGRQALKLKPTLAAARYFLALSLAETGGCEEALGLISKDLPRVRDAQLRRVMGLSGVRCSMSAGQPDTAVDFLRRLERDFPGDPEVLYLSAMVYSDLSTRASQRLLHNAPGSIQAHQLNAEVLEMQGNIEDARAEYGKILAMNPRAPGIHQRLGRLLLEAQRTANSRQEARREFEMELQIDPGNAAAEYELGEMARQARQWDEAIRHFRHATELDPSSVDALIGLGKSLVSASRPAEAVALLERAVKVDPANAVAHYQLSSAYRRVGREDDARRELALYQTAHDEEQRQRQAIRTGIQGTVSHPQTAEPPE